MQTRQDRTLTLLASAALCALVLSACGSGGSSDESQGASAATGASGATSATPADPAQGTSGASGTSNSSKKKSNSSKQTADSSTGKSGKTGGSKRAPKPSTGGSSTGGQSGGGQSGSSGGPVIDPPGKATTQQRKELQREAKIICTSLTLNGLAKEYVVKPTPDAVARAYSKGYVADLRGAAYKGCKSAFTSP